MQDMYAGDIGDYFKLSLLSALCPTERMHEMGIVWWRVANEHHLNDGRHITYLDAPEKWEAANPTLFRHLRKLVKDGQREIAMLEKASEFVQARFFNVPVPCPARWQDRRAAREAWIDQAVQAVSAARLVFIDPDNGFAPSGLKKTRRAAIKSIWIDELQCFHRQDEA